MTPRVSKKELEKRALRLAHELLAADVDPANVVTARIRRALRAVLGMIAERPGA